MKTSEALEKAESAMMTIADILRWSATRENTWIIPMVADSLRATTAVVNNLRGMIYADGDK